MPRAQRTLVVRRRLHRAALTRRQRDEAGVHEKGPSPFGPFLVLGPHRVGGLRVHAIQPLADLSPRATAVDPLGDLVRLVGEQVVLLASTFAELSGIQRKELLLT